MEVDELMASFGAVTMHGSIRPPASGPAATVDELTASFRAVTMHDSGTAPVALVDYDEPAAGEDACTLRVRLPDGRFICKIFGAGRPATALFRYCHSALTACSGGAAATPPFRLVRLAGGATEEIRPDETPLRDLGLHHCTIHLASGFSRPAIALAFAHRDRVGVINVTETLQVTGDQRGGRTSIMLQ